MRHILVVLIILFPFVAEGATKRFSDNTNTATPADAFEFVGNEPGQDDLNVTWGTISGFFTPAAHVGETNPHSVSLDQVDNPATSKTFTMGANALTFRFTNPAGGFFHEWIGAATGHLFELQQNTGNPGADAHLLHIEASDPDPLMIHLVPGAATSRAIKANVPGENAGPGRYTMDASGKMAWGDGTSATDVTLERTGAGAMRVTGDLDITGAITGDGSSLTGKIDSSGVTYENLDANGDVGTGAGQVAAGDDARFPTSLLEGELIFNNDMAYWSGGTTTVPDGYVLNGVTEIFSQETGVAGSLHGLGITYPSSEVFGMPVPLEPSTSYDFSVWLKVDVGGTWGSSGYFDIYGGGWDTASIVTVNPTTLTGTYQQFTGTIVTPATARTGASSLRLVLTTAIATDKIYVALPSLQKTTPGTAMPTASRAELNFVSDCGGSRSKTKDQNLEAMLGCISAASARGGANIIVPPGAYPIKPFTQSSGVAIKGPGLISRASSSWDTYGAWFIITDTTAPAITMEPETEISGIGFWYPEQEFAGSIPVVYPPAIKTTVGNTFIINKVNFGNAYWALDATSSHRYVSVDNCGGSPLYRGITTSGSVDIDRYRFIHFNPSYGYVDGGFPSTGLLQWVESNGIAFEVKGGDWLRFIDNFAYGYAVGFQLGGDATDSLGQTTLIGNGSDGGPIGYKIFGTAAQTWGIKILDSDCTAFKWKTPAYAGTCVDISGSPSGITIDNMRFWNGGTTAHAIKATGGSNILIDGFVLDAGGAGTSGNYFFDFNGVTDLKFTGGILDGNNLTGMHMFNVGAAASKVSITGNTIKDVSGANAVNIASGATGVKVIDNDVQDGIIVNAGTGSVIWGNGGVTGDGTIPASQLGTGTANSTTFLRGDNSWQVVSSGSSSGPTLETTYVVPTYQDFGATRNFDFETWTTTTDAAFWEGGATVTQETTDVIEGASALKFTNTSYTDQAVPITGYPQYSAFDIEISVWVKTTSSTVTYLRAFSNDWTMELGTVYATGSGSWERLVLQGKTINLKSTSDIHVLINGASGTLVDKGSLKLRSLTPNNSGAYTGLLKNSMFETWSAGASLPPDFFNIGSGVEILQSSSKPPSYGGKGYSAELTWEPGDSNPPFVYSVGATLQGSTKYSFSGWIMFEGSSTFTDWYIDAEGTAWDSSAFTQASTYGKPVNWQYIEGTATTPAGTSPSDTKLRLVVSGATEAEKIWIYGWQLTKGDRAVSASSDRIEKTIILGTEAQVCAGNTVAANCADAADIIAAANGGTGCEFTGSTVTAPTVPSGTGAGTVGVDVTGAVLGDFCVASRSGTDHSADVMYCKVTSADVATIYLRDATEGGYTMASQTFYVCVNSHP